MSMTLSRVCHPTLGGGHTERITRIGIDKQGLEHNDKIQKFSVVEGLDEILVPLARHRGHAFTVNGGAATAAAMGG